MKIAVIGTGYVGLTTGTCFAEMGNDVVCMDIDKKKIENLKNGIIPIYEPGLEELVIRNQKNGRLQFTTNAKEAIEAAEIVFSAVSTPPDKDHKADLKYVKEVAKTFGQHINEYKIFVNKSTVPVGTGDACAEIIREEIVKRGANVEFDAVSNPEFLREGSAISDSIKPDRVVVGYTDERAREKMERLYRVLKEKGVPIFFTDLKSAEIIKYASNSMLATKISFINEIANFCEKCGGDVRKIAEGIGLDSRIGKKFLNAGIGYGGSCFPKDVQALIQTGKEYEYDFKIIKAVEEVNRRQKNILLEKLLQKIGNVEGKTIGIWGLAFKPNTDDMREAPSINIIKALQELGANVQAFDPVAEEVAKTIFKNENLSYKQRAFDAAESADALMILTEWDEFRDIDLKELKTTMKGNLVLDGRNIFEKKDMENAGLKYLSIGQNYELPGERKHQEINKSEKTINVTSNII